jgi:flavin reductase (DIM6/NTAB) family NADH-FMN oxidoreductase RutF
MLSISFLLSQRRPKDTRENILRTKEFTVNIISEPFVHAANATAVESPADTNEWLLAGLTPAKSVGIGPSWIEFFD